MHCCFVVVAVSKTFGVIAFAEVRPWSAAHRSFFVLCGCVGCWLLVLLVVCVRLFVVYAVVHDCPMKQNGRSGEAVVDESLLQMCEQLLTPQQQQHASDDARLVEVDHTPRSPQDHLSLACVELHVGTKGTSTEASPREQKASWLRQNGSHPDIVCPQQQRVSLWRVFVLVGFLLRFAAAVALRLLWWAGGHIASGRVLTNPFAATALTSAQVNQAKRARK